MFGKLLDTVFAARFLDHPFAKMAAPRPTGGQDLFDTYFRRADLDGDGHISGAEAVAFFQGSNLPKHVLAQVLLRNLHLFSSFVWIIEKRRRILVVPIGFELDL